MHATAARLLFCIFRTTNVVLAPHRTKPQVIFAETYDELSILRLQNLVVSLFLKNHFSRSKCGNRPEIHYASLQKQCSENVID